MRTPAAAELLDAWEGGLGRSPDGRALALLASASPDADEDELARLPVGRRDARLLKLRRRLFGADLDLVTSCPMCGTALQSSLAVDTLVTQREERPDDSYACAADGYAVRFRLPTSADLIALGAEPARAAQCLLDRCVIDARDANGRPVHGGNLPASVAAAVAATMAECDPLADVQLAMTCPACRHRWDAPFDIASFLWKEVHAWAQRTLRDVHGLAAAYGWREDDVLRLSPTRRQIYLGLARR